LVDSEPDEAQTFTIYLPLIDQELKLDVKSDVQPAPLTLRGTETLLVVEDQEQIRKLVS